MGESDDERNQNVRLSVIYSEPDEKSASCQEKNTFVGDTDVEGKTKMLDDKTIPRVKLGFPAKSQDF